MPWKPKGSKAAMIARLMLRNGKAEGQLEAK
jgi:hypothetical protein